MPEVAVVLCLIDSGVLKYRNDILNTSEVISLVYTLPLLPSLKKCYSSIYMWLVLNKIKSNGFGVPVADKP